MTQVDIVGVGTPVNKYPDPNTIKFRTLPEYLEDAQKSISSIAPRFRQGLAEEMLRSEDAIAHVAQAIMMADWLFNGKGDLYGYRKQRVIWAIQNYLTRRFKASRHKVYSLDFDCGNGDKEYSFKNHVPNGDTLPDKSVAESEEVKLRQEKVDSLLNSGRLSEQQKSYLRSHFMDGKSYAQIGRDHQVSRESVRQVVKRALDELRLVLD